MNDSPSTDSVVAMSDTSLDALVLNIVFNTSDRLTPLELKRRVQQTYRPVKHGQFESSIKRLVEQKALLYTYQFGTSFLEPSFEKPVRVANSIILKPPNANYQALPDDIVVNIKAGAAFGTGIHPTTRLSLWGLEKVCTDNMSRIKEGGQRVLDIGTGSGVLAITAVKLGLETGIGLDIDPCARAEASENVKLNNLSQQVEISGGSLDSLLGCFFLITANLRLPTLKAYLQRMVELTQTGSFLVISGIKSNEIKQMKNMSKSDGMTVYWEGVEQEWGGLVLQR